MEFRIADTFVDSLTRLNGEEQNARVRAMRSERRPMQAHGPQKIVG